MIRTLVSCSTKSTKALSGNYITIRSVYFAVKCRFEWYFIEYDNIGLLMLMEVSQFSPVGDMLATSEGQEMISKEGKKSNVYFRN